ncbi:MAG: 50S ribosomal protein L25 [Limisphaerales bacterium]
MKAVSLTAYPRKLSGRNAVKMVRSAGRVPAVAYGRLHAAQNLELDSRQLDAVIHHSVSENILVDLTVEADARPTRLALVQDVQHDPLDGHVIHVDLHEVARDERVIINVPLESRGEPVGVKSGGGVLEHVVFKVKVRALPADLPEAVVVDVTALEINQTLHLSELPPIPGVEFLGSKDLPVFSVAAPRTEAEPAADAAAAPAGDVEMIKEKKDVAAAPALKAGDKAKPAEKGKDPGKEKKK